jgi:hypothetical protein
VKLKEKYPELDFSDTLRNPLPEKLIETILESPIPEKIELFKHLQKAADFCFRQMLQQMDMTQDQWNQMHDKMYAHFSATYKKEADAIRQRRRNS